MTKNSEERRVEGVGGRDEDIQEEVESAREGERRVEELGNVGSEDLHLTLTDSRLPAFPKLHLIIFDFPAFPLLPQLRSSLFRLFQPVLFPQLHTRFLPNEPVVVQRSH